jgi:hypothetical protein
MERQTALLFRRLGGDEPHIRPGNCFTDRLRVSSIVLLPFNVGLHVGWRHQRTVWPSALSSRDQWCDEAQAQQARGQLLKPL